MSRRRMLVCVLGCAGLVSACGSTTTVTRTLTHDVVRSSTATVTTTATRTPATSATTPATSSSASSASMCVASDLRLVSLGGGAATGHVLAAFGLRNDTDHACTTGGYPGVLFLDAAGNALATIPDHTTADFFGQTVLRELTVAPGGLVSFRLEVDDVNAQGTGSGCVTATGLQVIAPNDTATLRIAADIDECGGRASVSPLQVGTAARH